MYQLNRRQFLAGSAAAGIGCSGLLSLFAADSSKRYQIGACDWSLGKMGDLDALAVAREIGLDGVQVTFGKPGAKVDLRREEDRAAYRKACSQNGVEIASLAMGVLNAVPYSSSPDAEKWVAECVETMPKMQQQIVLLAFFGKGDIKEKPELQQEVIRRLKKVAPKAEKAGVILAIESWLDVDAHLRILDGVGSPAVQVYYDTANMHKQGYDIYSDIRRLGRERICQLHCKENGVMLGEGEIDFRRVKEAIEDIGYRGWLVIESAMAEGKSITECYTHNQEFLRKIFL